MKEVYSLAYDYFWEDGGNWYVHSQYSKENIKEELAQENTEYYFVVYNGERIGNFRIHFEAKLRSKNKSRKRLLQNTSLRVRWSPQGSRVNFLCLLWSPLGPWGPVSLRWPQDGPRPQISQTWY